MLPSSDLLFALPVESGLVSIPRGHIELLRPVNSLAARRNPFFFWSLWRSALRIARRSRCCKKHAFRTLTGEDALCWSNSFFEVKHFQYTLLATPADKSQLPAGSWPHSSVPMSAFMRSGLRPVHRGFIAMSGRSFRPAQIPDELPVERALNPLRGFVPTSAHLAAFEVSSMSHARGSAQKDVKYPEQINSKSGLFSATYPGWQFAD
jgi:hypothetical protein